MELIKEFTVGLVVVCIIGAVIIVLSPEGSIEKTVKTIVSLVMLLCFIYPFCSGADFDFGFDLKVDSGIEMSADELLTESFRSKLVSDICSYLENNGVDVVGVEIDMHTSDENEIIIERVTVFIHPDDETKQEYVKNIIKDRFGIVCNSEVSYESENQ